MSSSSEEPFSSRQLENDPLRASILDEVLSDLSSVQPWKSYTSECSYCRRPKNDGRAAYGLHAHKLNVIDYENLLELGFIRSGRHVYKPMNDVACCPNLPIRLDALSFAPSRSHGKVLKKLSDYLTGKLNLVLPQKITDPFSRCYALAQEGKAQEAAEAVVRYHDSGDFSLSSTLGIQFLDEEHEHLEHDDIDVTAKACESISRMASKYFSIPPTISLLQPFFNLSAESIENADDHDISRLAVTLSLSSLVVPFFFSPSFREIATLALNNDEVCVDDAISRCERAVSRIHVAAMSKKVAVHSRSFSCNIAFIAAASFFIQTKDQERKLAFQSSVAEVFVRYLSHCNLSVSVIPSASGPGFVNLLLSPTEDLITVRANLLHQVKNSRNDTSSEIDIKITHVDTVESLLRLIPEPLNCVSAKTQLERKALRAYYNHQQDERERIGRLKLQNDSWHLHDENEKPEVLTALTQLEELYDKEDLEAVQESVKKLNLASGSLVEDSSSSFDSAATLEQSERRANLEQSARRALLEFQAAKSAEREESLSAAKKLAEASAEKKAFDENVAKSKESLLSFVEMGLGSRMERLRKQAESNASLNGDILSPFGRGQHKLTVTLTKPEYSLDSHEIYARFNMALHRGYPFSQSKRSFTRHLIDSPVEPMAAWKLGKSIASICTPAGDAQEVAQSMRNEVDDLLNRGRQFYNSIPKSSNASSTSTEKSESIFEDIPKRSVIRIARTLLEPVHSGMDSVSTSSPSLEAVLRSLAVALNEPSLEPCDDLAPDIIMSLAESSGPPSMWMLATLQEIFNPTSLDIREAVERASSLLTKAQDAHNKASDSVSSSSSTESNESNEQPDAKKTKLTSSFNTGDLLTHAQNEMKKAKKIAPLQYSAPESLFRPPAVPKCIVPLLCELVDMHYGDSKLRSGVILGIYLVVASLVEQARARLLLIQDHNAKMANFEMEKHAWIMSHPCQAMKLQEKRRLSEDSQSVMDVELMEKDKIDEVEQGFPQEANTLSSNEPTGCVVLCESCLTETEDAVCATCGVILCGQDTCASCGASSTVSCSYCGALETSPFPPKCPVGPDPNWLSEKTIGRSYSIIYETARLMGWQGGAVERLLRRTGNLVSSYSENIRNRQNQRSEQSLGSLSSSTAASSCNVSSLETCGPSFSSDTVFSQYFTKIHTPGCLRHGAEPRLPHMSSSPSDSDKDSNKIAISGWDLPFGFGTFFHEYRLDGELVAISVLDILPSRVASIYFFYDPDFRYLELGKLSALVEIYMVQQISAFTRDHPELTTCLPTVAGGSLCRHWDANFYVHSCGQMNYKRSFQPSEVQCPTTTEWVPLDSRALKLLDKDPQATLSSNSSVRLNPNFGPRSILALPRVMMKLDGVLLPFPFAGLTEHSQKRCKLGIERYIMAVGVDFALSVLCDPNGVATEHFHYEKKLNDREQRKKDRSQRQELTLSALLPTSSNFTSEIT